MRNFIFTTLILIVLTAQISLAQALPQDIDISLYPIDPKPGESVTATATSFGMDLTGASVSWYYNNKLISSGTGETSVRFTAPNSGQLATLSVRASDGSGDAENSIVIRPASVDLVWEAIDAYTPPFYKGKALAPIGGRIRVTAVPSASAPRTLSYSWKYNDSAVPSQSGLSKNSLTIKTDVLGGNESFSLQASGGTFEGGGKTSVVLRNPDIVLYQKSNGFIDYSRGSIGDVFIGTPGITLRVEPFNFSTNKTFEQSLEINFALGDQSFTGINQTQELPISRPDSGENGDLTINTTSLLERLQVAKRTFTLRF
ncbi:MAG: hypothetical protein AAB681_01180 [Patescibacteria group bacterium]